MAGLPYIPQSIDCVRSPFFGGGTFLEGDQIMSEAWTTLDYLVNSIRNRAPLVNKIIVLGHPSLESGELAKGLSQTVGWGLTDTQKSAPGFRFELGALPEVILASPKFAKHSAMDMLQRSEFVFVLRLLAKGEQTTEVLLNANGWLYPGHWGRLCPGGGKTP